MRILLSLLPEFAEGILSGAKRFEYRKVVPKRSEVRTVVIYATMPVGMVVGEFEIKEVIKDHPTELWERTEWGAGISEEYFKRYYSGRKQGVAFAVKNPRRYDKPLSLLEVARTSTPPQSFQYIP